VDKPKDQPVEAIITETEWTCVVCTLTNPLTVKSCDACDTLNPFKTKQVEAEVEAAVIRREKLLTASRYVALALLGGLLLYFTLSVLVCCATFAATFAQSLLENLRNIEVTMPQLPQMPQLSVEDDPDVAKYEFKADYYGVNLVLYVGFTIFFIFAVSIFK